MLLHLQYAIAIYVKIKSILFPNVICQTFDELQKYQCSFRKDEEAEREKPIKVVKASKKVASKGQRAHDHMKNANKASISAASDDLSQSLEKAKKLLDVKAAIEKMRLRGQDSEEASEISTSSGSTVSSSGSDSENNLSRYRN